MTNRVTWLVAAMTLALLAQRGSPVQAQADRQGNPPAIVVSLASYDKVMTDLRYGGDVAGASQYIGFLQLVAGNFTRAIDTTRPSGVLVDFDGETPLVTAFIPVRNLQQLLDLLADHVGPARDIGNGIKQLDGPQPLFIKEVGGFAFATNDADNLANVPQNPVALLGGAEALYDLAVTVHVQSIPQHLRDAAVEQLRDSFEMQMEAQNQQRDGELDAAEREIQEQLSRSTLEGMTMFVQQSDQFKVGWAIDPATQSTYLDISMTAVAGTEFAEQMAQMQDSRTNFAGLLASAPVTLGMSSRLSSGDKQQAIAMIDALEAKARSEIDADGDLSDTDRPLAKRVLATFVEIAKATIEEGIADGGAMLTTRNDSLQVVAGVRVADGAELDRAVKWLVDLAKNEPDFPEVKLDALQHNGVNVHTALLPVADDGARRVFGDSLEVALGTGVKSAYLAFGPGSVDLLKEVIDKSVGEPNKETLPAQLSISLTPLLRFGARLEPDNHTLTQLLAALERSQGRDQIAITARAIPRGFTYRVDLQEGILRMIGGAINAGFQGNGDF